VALRERKYFPIYRKLPMGSTKLKNQMAAVEMVHNRCRF
jgi:hypothetical protein